MHDDAHCYQNSGVSLVAKTMLVSSAKDKKPIVADICFYGIIEDIWLLDYCSFKIPVFKCQWEKSDGGVRVDELGFTLVDLERKGHKDEPFILATQAKQVFYVEDPENPKWSCVIANSHADYGNIAYDGDESKLSMGLHFPAKSLLKAETIDAMEDNEEAYVGLDAKPMYID